LYFFHFVTYEKLYGNPFRNILINYFKKSEMYFPGSSLELSEKLVDKFINPEKKQKARIVDNNVTNFKKFLLQKSKESTINNFLNILEFSGPNALINCDTTKNNFFSVEKTTNPIFEINIHEEFKEVFFKNQSSLTKNYLVCLYDGFVERESELYSVLEKSKENENIPIALICRGISSYAIKNIKNILLKNNIQLLPYICSFNNEDPFAFEDLEKILNIKGYKLESGDNLYKKISENSKIRNLKLRSENIEVIENYSKKLQKEISDSLTKTNDESVKKYLYKRKNRCSPNIVYIKIPETSVNLLNEYKNLIKCYNIVAINGLIEINDKLYSYYSYTKTNILSKNLYETLKSIGCIVKLKENKLCQKN